MSSGASPIHLEKSTDPAMKSTSLPTARTRGFALVVTLSLMILLTVIAVGLLSLSSISLRRSGVDSSGSIARANARLALMLALGELQKNAGDDRRITVDASIIDGAKNPNVVGVWKSWSPGLVTNPTAAPDYQTEKDKQFVGWLASTPNPADLSGKDWAKSGTLAAPVDLFAMKSDGFRLSGSKVDVGKGTPSAGTMAWAVVQDATRAKINVGGPEMNKREGNDDLQAQARPTLSLAETFKQPADQWNSRASKVISLSQAKLDKDLWKAAPPVPEGSHFTAQGYGLLTDVVNGGLKTDLSLGFEMTDSDFKKDSWGSFKNPFRAASAPLLNTPSSYKGERPLFKPLTASGSVRADLLFAGADTTNQYPAGAVPTFATLRSFYRTPYHVYSTADGPTIFERGMDHVALTQPSGGIAPSPAASPPALKSQTGYRPVLDRVLYVFSAGLSGTAPRLILTPVITLWNPYNVALEIEGAVAYPWLDMPMRINWKCYDGSTGTKLWEEQTYRGGHSMGALLHETSNRSSDPFFFAGITPDGSSTVGSGKSIRFAPGEVRVFVPSSPTPVEFNVTGNNKNRSVYLRPVQGSGDFSLTGGFSIPMYNPTRDAGIKPTRAILPTNSVEVAIIPMNDTQDSGNYFDTPFNVGLEDATRLKSSTLTDRGQAVGEVQSTNIISSGAATTIRSARMSATELASPALRKPFGMFETYHRVAADAEASRRSDLVLTINPRQPFINGYLTKGNFVSAPHYETKMRELSSINSIIEVKGGRSAYYGASNNSSTGRSHLSFFEVPQAPLLSLAGFQHADLAGTAYSPAYQFGNSWASAYLAKNKAAVVFDAFKKDAGTGGGKATISVEKLPVYDFSYLTNECLWDSFFFSGAAPKLAPGTTSGKPANWDSSVANVSETYDKALGKFIDDPVAYPLRNARMRLVPAGSTPSQLKTDLITPQGCLKIAANLQVDGAFNINSTSEKAWIAFLGGMKNGSFKVEKDPSSPASGGGPGKDMSSISRFRNPVGTENDNWMGFRSLTDAQLAEFAKNMVIQIKKRGPFLSLGEFVNRRIDSSDLALKGAIQAAIDDSNLNGSALYDNFDTQGYPAEGKSNIVPANIGVGIPGYLTQADVLQSIAPVMTVRSDTLTIRGYGEARDASGKLLASAWCEAVVQRTPEFVDATQPPHTAMADLNPANQTFGRRYSIVSFRHLNKSEVGL
jgi:hypothetical protein